MGGGLLATVRWSSRDAAPHPWTTTTVETAATTVVSAVVAVMPATVVMAIVMVTLLLVVVVVVVVMGGETISSPSPCHLGLPPRIRHPFVLQREHRWAVHPPSRVVPPRAIPSRAAWGEIGRLLV
jgi:hypothetical protein